MKNIYGSSRILTDHKCEWNTKNQTSSPNVSSVVNGCRQMRVQTADKNTTIITILHHKSEKLHVCNKQIHQDVYFKPASFLSESGEKYAQIKQLKVK